MRIVCIGWGSLIWRPEPLKIKGNWYEDGPLLPIEFTRISNNNRVTLIVDSGSKPVLTLWAFLTYTSLDNAKEALMRREKIERHDLVHSIGRDDVNSPDETSQTIKNWLIEKQIDYAVWTGLSYSNATGRKRPTIEQILIHLRKLNSNERNLAEEYIRKVPRQIDTEYRRQIELELGWIPVA